MPPIPYFLLGATVLPLVSFAVLLVLGRRLGRWAGPMATALMMGSFALSVGALVLWVAKSADRPEMPTHDVELVNVGWAALPRAAMHDLAGIPQPAFSMLVPARVGGGGGAAAGMGLGILVDSLTMALFVVMTFIMSLVHLYAIPSLGGSGRGEGPRFFALLGLLCFGALGLFLSNSLIAIFLCWSLLGVASCLLIGRRHEHRDPARAALRAMVIQMVGNGAFLMGVGILVLHSGSAALSLYDSQGASGLAALVRDALGVRSTEYLFFTSNPGHPAALHWLTWSGLCFFVAATAMAGQFPLYAWLEGAAEAPAAALIGAPTTVAAGVYLMARLYPILTMDARLAVAILGCVTLVIAALVALVQADVRKIIAWTGISQAGYMFLFLGSGAYVAGLLHLFTTAFGMACLFLCVGTIFHALQRDERAYGIRNLGGLWKRVPITAAAALVAGLALAGAPALSGAYSRDMGLACVYDYSHALAQARVHDTGQFPVEMLLFWVPMLTTFLTAVGLARFWWLTFAGKNRLPKLLDVSGGAEELAQTSQGARRRVNPP